MSSPAIVLPDRLLTEDSPLHLYRIHPADRGPDFFGRTGMYRFDSPDRGYGVLYAATSREGAFVEAVLRQSNGGVTTVSRTFLAKRKLSTLVLTRPLRAAKIHGNGLAANRTNADITSGWAYDMSQAYSQAIHQHADSVAGMSYRCRHDNEQIGWALFDRCRELIERFDTPDVTLDEDDDWIEEIEDRYRIVFR